MHAKCKSGLDAAATRPFICFENRTVIKMCVYHIFQIFVDKINAWLHKAIIFPLLQYLIAWLKHIFNYAVLLLVMTEEFCWPYFSRYNTNKAFNSSTPPFLSSFSLK